MMIRPNRIGRRWLGIPAVTPRSLFLNGEDGFVFDFSTSASLYTDAAGTTALSAPGQTIGLAADKSRVRSPVTACAGVQASAGLRPTYGRAPKSRRNLLSNSEDFSSAVWTKAGATVTANAIAAPDGTLTADLLAEDGTTGVHRTLLATAITVVTGTVLWHSVYVRAAGRSRVVLADNALVMTVFNLTTGVVVSGAGAISDAGGGWWRLSIPRTAASTSEGIVLYLDNGASTNYAGDGVSGVHVWGAQLELVGLSAYQRASSAFDLTEAGVPAFGYARLDGADDKLTITLPASITGDLMIFGRNGSWIEAGVTLPSGAFDLGPTGTVLTPGVLSALGDLVGAVIIARTTTAAERALALRYFAARGAAGWLVTGAEGVVNGLFTTDAAGWVSTNATLAVVAGELEFTNTVAGAHNVQRGVAVTPGVPYLLSFDARLGTMTVLRYSVYNATGAANIVAPTTYAATGVTKRFQFVFIPPASCVTANVYMARDSGSAGTAYFDNVSCKPLNIGA